MSTVSEARLREERCSLWSLEEEWRDELLLLDLWDEDLEEDLDEDLEDDLEEDLCESVGTSRMFSSRPVVGSTVEVTLGLWATW
jgi:hypothetical protein